MTIFFLVFVVAPSILMGDFIGLEWVKKTLTVTIPFDIILIVSMILIASFIDFIR